MTIAEFFAMIFLIILSSFWIIMFYEFLSDIVRVIRISLNRKKHEKMEEVKDEADDPIYKDYEIDVDSLLDISCHSKSPWEPTTYSWDQEKFEKKVSRVRRNKQSLLMRRRSKRK